MKTISTTLNFTLHNALKKAAGLAVLIGYLTFQGQAKAAPIDQSAKGYLKVFSSTQESQWGEGSYYNLHTSYAIYDCHGRKVKSVANHSDSADEDPQKVELAPGKYVVWAQSDTYGFVKTVVTIKPSQLSAVHLEKGDADESTAVKPAATGKSLCQN